MTNEQNVVLCPAIKTMFCFNHAQQEQCDDCLFNQSKSLLGYTDGFYHKRDSFQKGSHTANWHVALSVKGNRMQKRTCTVHAKSPVELK